MHTTSSNNIPFFGLTGPLSTLLRAAFDVLFLLILTLIPAITVVLDLRWLNNGVGEDSITELLQAGVLLSIVICLYWKGRTIAPARTFLWLLAGFFGCLLIRELDVYFDMVWHGFWLYPALLLGSLTLVSTWRHGRDTLISGFVLFARHRSSLFTLFGLLLVAVFSRVFGSGSLIWNELLGMDSAFDFKTALQEGIELLGYNYAAYGILTQGGYMR